MLLSVAFVCTIYTSIIFRGRRGLLPMRGGRGGGGMMMNRGGGGGPPRRGPGGPQGPLIGTAPRPPFDLALCEPMFPKVADIDDSALTQVSVLLRLES